MDGIVGANTWKALVPAPQKGATGDAVRAVQNTRVDTTTWQFLVQ